MDKTKKRLASASILIIGLIMGAIGLDSPTAGIGCMLFMSGLCFGILGALPLIFAWIKWQFSA